VDDKLFIFGFSCSAYTVRAVVSLLHMYGLARPDNEPLVPYGIRLLPGIQWATPSGVPRTRPGYRWTRFALTVSGEIMPRAAR
jgi:uncharacterized protein (DUF2235 family)